MVLVVLVVSVVSGGLGRDVSILQVASAFIIKFITVTNLLPNFTFALIFGV